MQDPVCGMDVEPNDAAAAWEHAGQTYLFCCVGCMERFRRDPDHYLALDPSERHM
jgi:Cu+-exporting ATPase